MRVKISKFTVCICFFAINGFFTACVPNLETKTPSIKMPDEYIISTEDEKADEVNRVNWQEYFQDSNLVLLINEALKNNQELHIFMQEMQIEKNEIGARQGAYLPKIELGAEAGLDKVGEYTRPGAVESSLDIEEGKKFPDPLPEYFVGAHASWEVDIWNKLRNAEKSALMKYLASVEGRNFMVTNLIAEIARSYFELLALDRQFEIVQQNLNIQSNVLEIVKLKKQGARVTELALRRFQAQLYRTKALKFKIRQKIVETENRINFLVGRYPQSILRKNGKLDSFIPQVINSGIPSKLIENRPDIRQAELELAAADLDVKVAKANFYPSFTLTGRIGMSAYDTSKILETPESLAYALGGGVISPFINRKEFEAVYYNAGANQIKAVINYERTVLKAFMEVTNLLSSIRNLGQSTIVKTKEVKALNESVEISTTLFNAARADYMEVLMTQRDSLEARFELIETKLKQLNAAVNIYRSLGGGWDNPEVDKQS